MLTDSEKCLLLRVARSAIETAVCRRSEPPPEEFPPSLLQHGGAFVTLHLGTELRGCIGYIESVNSLVDTVCEVAAKAALEDYRFEPVMAGEIPDLTIEISVLSPLSLMRDPDEIVIGTHGLLLEHRHARGLLLPQVATEHGWDREMFLMQTARKAGLAPSMCDHPDTKIFLFTAQVFHEDVPSSRNTLADREAKKV